MVTKFLEGNKLKTSFKKWICTVSNFIHFIQFYLISQILAKFLGLNPTQRYLSLQKRKQNFYVVFTCSIKRARAIRNFHVAVVQWQLRNVQESVMPLQSCFANLNLLLFCHSHCHCHHHCLTLLLSSKNFATMLTWRHTSPLCRLMQPKKSKTIGYKPRAKFSIITGQLSKQTSQKTLENGSLNTKPNELK